MGRAREESWGGVDGVVKRMARIGGGEVGGDGVSRWEAYGGPLQPLNDQKKRKKPPNVIRHHRRRGGGSTRQGQYLEN